MLFAAVFVRRQAEEYRGRLLPCHSAMFHPADAGVDGQSDPSAAGRLPPPPPLLFFPARRVADAGGELVSPPPSTTPAVLPPSRSTLTPQLQSCPPSPSPTPRLTAPTARPPLHSASLRQPRRCSSLGPSSLTPTTPPSPAASAGESPNPNSGSGGSRFRRSSTIYAAKMVEAMAEEDAEVSKKLSSVATADQVAAVHGAIEGVSRRLEAHAQSQAAANGRANAAFVALNKVAASDAAPSGVLACPPSRAVSMRQAQRTGGLVAVGSGRVATRDDPAVSSFSPTAASPSGAVVSFYCPLVHDWALSVEMMTKRMDAKPLFLQLTDMLRLCHVSADHQGLFGSFACNQLYEEGVERTKAVVRDGGKVAVVNSKKTDKMKSIIKNKANRYLKELFWLFSVVPGLFKAPAEATFAHMHGVTIDDDQRTTLTAALIREADALGLPPNHCIRLPTKARSNTLRAVLHARVGRTAQACTVEHMLSVSPFKELLAEAQKNVRRKYA